eukprot:m.12417 g.12417  ORF g.12417 m.12417 type:complete len:300 (+) comp24036_c0_seq2:39-938(+)
MFSSAFHRLYGSSRFITNSVIPFSSFGKGTAFLSIQSGNREAPHFKRSTGAHPLEKEEESRYSLPHPIWNEDDVRCVTVTHYPPITRVDKAAFYAVQLLRFGFDVFSGFKFGERNESKWLRRIIFLETVAGVPGMVAAMARHLHSLRKLKRDHGWIHTLLEEAENERMHLLTFLELKKPGIFFRLAVLFAQGSFVNMFFLSYLVSPKFCHRFVGYLEEEAVKTYTKCLEDLDDGKLKSWSLMPSPPVAKTYWNLPDDATMKDVVYAIRADEAHHRVVNHTLGSMHEDDPNPHLPGIKKL